MNRFAENSAQFHRFVSRGTLLTLACTGLFATSVRANLITNGSFESPDVHGAFNTAIPSAWTLSGTGVYITDSSSPGISPEAEDGSQYLIMTAGSLLTQSFTVPTAGEYKFSWYDNTSSGFSTKYDALISGPTTGGLSDINATGSSSWALRSVTETLNAGVYTFKFDSAKSSAAPFFDNLNVEAVSIHGVPDSGGTLALGSISFAILGIIGKRVRRKDMIQICNV